MISYITLVYRQILVGKVSSARDFKVTCTVHCALCTVRPRDKAATTAGDGGDAGKRVGCGCECAVAVSAGSFIAAVAGTT